VIALPGERVTRIRKNLEANQDPYLADQERHGVEECKECQAIYLNHRWYLPDMVPEGSLAAKLKDSPPAQVLCPACRKTHDHHPGGVLMLSGSFLAAHRQDILNLIHNENHAAQTVNPLDRVISVEEDGDSSLIVLTTREKLAQRVGRAVHKAYSGCLQVHWPEDGNLARVRWHRDG
jgi:hypothetical protein